MNILRALVLLMLTLFVSSVVAEEALERPSGAACMVRVDGKLLLSSELITGKIALPGGALDAGEEPEQAALRELYEEVGIEATATRLLPFSNRYTHLFECLPKQAVTAFSTLNRFGANIVPIAQAEHYGVETKGAMLIELDLINRSDLRFGQRLEEFHDLFPHLIDTPAIYVEHQMSQAARWHRFELNYFLKYQANETLNKLFDPLMLVVDRLLSPFVFMLVLPFVYWRLGRLFAVEMMFIVGSVSLAASCLQLLTAQPLPLAYVPGIGSVSFYGFSLPNREVAVLFAVSALLKHRLQWSRVLFLATVLGVYGASQWLLGKAFISDLVAGGLLGYLMGSAMVFAEENYQLDLRRQLISWPAWLAMLVVTGMALMIWQVPLLVDSFVMLTTLAVLVRLRLVADSSSHLSLNEVIKISVVLSLLYLALNILKSTVSAHTHLALIYDAFLYPWLMLALVLMLPRRTLSKEGSQLNEQQ